MVALIASVACTALGADGSWAINGDTIARFVGRTHAILVHFPIALLIVAATVEVIAALRDRFGPAERPLTISHAGLVCIGFGAAGAIAASTAGWLNADIEGVGSSVAGTLFWHRWLGITVCIFACTIIITGLLARSGVRRRAVVMYRSLLLVAALLVGITGHLGGDMVYGSDYLLSAFKVRAEGGPKPEGGSPSGGAVETPPKPLDDGGNSIGKGGATSAVVTPAAQELGLKAQQIFDARCIDCHGARRAKGDLRLDTLDFAKASNSVIAGKPDESDLIQRLLLPEDHDDYMPQDDPPLPQEEINTLRAWVQSLAVAPAAAPAPTGSDASSAQPAARPPAEAPAPAKTPEASAGNKRALVLPKADPIVLTDAQRAARDQAVQAIRKAGAYAGPIAGDSELIHVNFAIIGKACTDQTLGLLSGLEPVLHELNLSGTAVSDEGLKLLPPLKRLERLNLSRTAVTDAGMKTVATLASLTWLNLHNTQVGDGAIEAMVAMPALKNAVLWRTGMTVGGLSRLVAARSDLSIETGAVLPAKPQPDAASAQAQSQPVPSAEGEKPLPLAVRLPGCCAKAKEQGKECDHPCCVAARAKGEVCAKCLGPA